MPAKFDRAPGRPARPPPPAAAPIAAAGLRPPSEERSAETRSDEPGVAVREHVVCTGGRHGYLAVRMSGEE